VATGCSCGRNEGSGGAPPPFPLLSPRPYLLATSMSKVSGVISCRTRPDQPLGPQDLSPRGLDSLRLCDAVAWSEVAYGAVRAAPVRGRCIAGPRHICVGGGAWCDLGASVHGGCLRVLSCKRIPCRARPPHPINIKGQTVTFPTSCFPCLSRRRSGTF
jgi:hypothetical protein